MSIIIAFIMATTPITQDYALEQDAKDPLAEARSEYVVTKHLESGEPTTYFSDMSLGLAQIASKESVRRYFDEVEYGHRSRFNGDRAWVKHPQKLHDKLAKIVGARADEVIIAGTTQTNANLLLNAFYKPTPERNIILLSAPTFSGNSSIANEHVQMHGYSETESVLTLQPKEGKELVSTNDILEALEERGSRISVVFLDGVNYVTGQALDIKRITQKAHEKGCKVIFDLAQAVGNIPLNLHEWNVDAANWCHYKFLSGPNGGTGGLFVHQRHGEDPDLLRPAGWKAEGPGSTRGHFVPKAGAAGFQLSSSSTLDLYALEPSLELFDKVGMDAVVEKSRGLTTFFLALLQTIDTEKITIVTPEDPSQRGCMISLKVTENRQEIVDRLYNEYHIDCDTRDPHYIRFALTPLHTSYNDVYNLAKALKEVF